MSDLSRDALYTLMQAYLDSHGADPATLRLAASSHIADSRTYGIVAAEYKASLEQPVPDLELQQQLAEELHPLRQALSILDGVYPGAGITITAEKTGG